MGGVGSDSKLGIKEMGAASRVMSEIGHGVTDE